MWRLEGWKELFVLGSKEVCLAKVKLSNIAAMSHMWFIEIEMCSKYKIHTNL